MVKINTSICEITCNIKARPGGGGIGAAAAAAAWPGRWGWPEAADELAGNSRGLAGSSRWLAGNSRGAGGAGCSLTAAADALGAAGGEKVSHTAADAGNTRKNMRKYTQKYKNITI